jgi:protocatechuate 3,4-dioxygenase beta subunit
MIHSMTRREAVALVGLSGIALLARRSAAQGTGRVPACVVRPQQTEGPFFIEDKLNRSDIRTDPGRSDARPGTVLQLAFAVSRLSGGACAPLSGAQVDVWHCDALGAYSDGAQKFLRGYQVTDDTGAARFVTIYPGAYQGRAVHIHFKIRLTAQKQEFTSQIYFDEAVTDRVYALEPYARNGPRRLRNDGDGLFRSGGRQLLVTPTPSGAGYATTFDIALST